MPRPDAGKDGDGTTVRRSEALMGTIVTIDVPGHAIRSTAQSAADLVDRAFRWFREVEQTCSRFDPTSELRQLDRQVGTATVVSPILFETLRFVLTLSAETDGAFDPTVGRRLEDLGFNRDYRTGQPSSGPSPSDDAASWRDVVLDDAHRTIVLRRPLVLDLGAVAKGLALDLAARELRPLGAFAIDAGGDLYLGGSAANGRPWTVGIRHPDRDDVLLGRVTVRNRAVCTSGLYERTSSTAQAARHIIDPRDGSCPTQLISTTVIAPTGMLADALATAVLVLGSGRGRELLETHGVCGVAFTASGERLTTKGCERDVFTSN